MHTYLYTIKLLQHIIANYFLFYSKKLSITINNYDKLSINIINFILFLINFILAV